MKIDINTHGGFENVLNVKLNGTTTLIALDDKQEVEMIFHQILEVLDEHNITPYIIENLLRKN